MQDDAPPPADGPTPGDGLTLADGPAAADHPLSVGSESAYELLQRGHGLMRGRHNAQAAVVLERAARIEPGRGSILEALGRARFNSGQHALALEAFEALLEVDPASAFGHFALAQAMRKVGRATEAVTHLRLACALAPDSAVYRGALSRATASLPGPPSADSG